MKNSKWILANNAAVKKKLSSKISSDSLFKPVQVRKVEDEKGLLERRYKEELEQQRQELAARAAELGSAGAAAEKLRRSEQDLRRQLEEKERFAAQVHALYKKISILFYTCCTC
jgi:hypothetical protein